MARHKYKLSLHRRKKKSIQVNQNVPVHSTPFKKRKAPFEKFNHTSPTVSPIKQRKLDHGTHNCSNLLCTRCGNTALDNTNESLLACVHNFDLSALCDTCGTNLHAKDHFCTVTSDEKFPSFDNTDDQNELSKLLEQCQEKLVTKGFPDFLHKMMLAIQNDKLDTDSLTFAIISETISALTSDTLNSMRYSWKSKCFWKLVITKCGGMVIRLLSGWKCIGSVLSGDSSMGSIDSDAADFILAIPNEDILRTFDPYNGDWPQQISTGFFEPLAMAVSASTKETSVCLSLDGKKITPGLKENKGDIDLLGREEDGVTLQTQLDQYRNEQEELLKTIKLIDQFVPGKTHNLTDMLQWTITLLSLSSTLVCKEVDKKRYALKMLKKRAGEDYKTSRFCFVIHLVIATLVELEQCQMINSHLRGNLLNALASLQGKELFQMKMHEPLILWKIPNYCSLPDIDALLNSSDPTCQAWAAFLEDQGSQYVKQRSSPWFAKRKEVKVTGSRLFQATGAGGLKALKEHCLQVFRGKEPPDFSPEVQAAMTHGQEHEPDATATFCQLFLPAFFPTAAVYEVGCVTLDQDGVRMLVSPDGIVTDTSTGQIIAVLEIKCPYTAPLHIEIPVRYYLQVQAEIMAMDVEYAFFVSYKSDSTRIFKVDKDMESWTMAVECLVDTFVNQSGKIPQKLPIMSKTLLQCMTKKVKSNCTLIAEVPSLTVVPGTEPQFPQERTHASPTTHLYPDPFVADLPDININWDASATVSLLETATSHHCQIHQLLRKKATEVITMVASDTDRLWSKNQKIGAPLCYFLKGYSLSMTVMRNILEDTLDNAFRCGIHVPCVAFDGQFMKLLREDRHGNPLTVLQVQKQYWSSVLKMSKVEILTEIKSAGVVHSLADVSMECESFTTTDGMICDRLLVQRTNISSLPKSTVNKGLNGTCKEDKTMQDKSLVVSDIDEAEAENLIQDALQCSDDQENCDDNYDLPDLENGHNSHTGSDNIVDKPQDVLSQEQCGYLLSDLSDQFPSWKSSSVLDLSGMITDCAKLSKLKVPELKVIAKFLKLHLNVPISLTGTKHELLSRISTFLKSVGVLSEKPRRKVAVPSLRQLSTQCLNKSPKMMLNVVYATWKFPAILQDWKLKAPVKYPMTITEIDDKAIEWFYVPELSETRHQLEVKKIDPHHLLTRHRSAICKGDLGTARKRHFVEVARENTTALKAGMMEEQLNMQSTDYARITFSLEVENELRKKDHTPSADLCKHVREWFDSCDVPGIPATERCRYKLRYRNHLLSLANLTEFPPPGSHVQGYPVPLWEAAIASTEADLFMYALTKRRTYNSRALSSQPCESLYSCLATMPGARNGVPSCVDLEINMAKLCGECTLRQDPNRGFSVRLSSAPVYPQVLLEKDTGPLPIPVVPPVYIEQICITDHLFDASNRRRRAQQSPRGLTSLHLPGRGGMGVRHYHKVNECNINPLIRAGISAEKAEKTALQN